MWQICPSANMVLNFKHSHTLLLPSKSLYAIPHAVQNILYNRFFVTGFTGINQIKLW